MPTRILVVDDDRVHLRTYLKAILRAGNSAMYGTGANEGTSPSVEVIDADKVADALGRMRTERFEILVVDLKIPGSAGQEMGGLELIEESQKLDPLRFIIVITGYGTIELTKKALSQGIVDFIEKSPTAAEELVNAIQRAIQTRNEKIRRSGNPFTPMVGLEPVVFGGRTRELEFFEAKLNRAIHKGFCEHFLVLGSWGIGKSTLLREYKKIAQSRGYISCIVPLEPLQQGIGLI